MTQSGPGLTGRAAAAALLAEARQEIELRNQLARAVRTVHQICEEEEHKDV
jgi:hypothetical protein